LNDGVDTLVLGCTHYPFLRDQIAAIAGRDVLLIDPADAVAKELARRMGKEMAANLAAHRQAHHAPLTVFTSQSSGELARVVAQLWGEPVAVHYEATI
jgi:glutamate racemase